MRSILRRHREKARRACGLFLAGLVLLQAANLRAATRLFIESDAAVDTQPVAVRVMLEADGDEHAVGFSLEFDPDRFAFIQAVRGAGAEAAAAASSLNLASAASGRIGAVFSRSPGNAFEAGTHELLRIRFQVSGGAGSVGLSFSDTPVLGEIVTVDGVGIAATFVDGVIAVQAVQPPMVLTQPQSVSVPRGANGIFQVRASSNVPLTYQWFRGDAPISGATGSTWVVRDAQPSDAGDYRVEIRNGAGVMEAGPAELTVAGELRDALVGQWNFDDIGLTAEVGDDLEFLGDTGTVTEFTTMEIDGEPAGVMRFPRATGGQGYRLFPGQPGNRDGVRMNHYTLVMDVRYPAAANGRWRALLQTNPANADDGEFFVNPGNGIGISGSYHGQVLPDTWHRIALAVDLQNGTLGKFIDGELVGIQGLTGVDGRWSLGQEVLLFTDNSGETEGGFVASIQLYETRVSDERIRELGGARADGLPTGSTDGLVPTFQVQPLGQTVLEGETVTFDGRARGTPPLQFQWFKDDAPIAGATGSRFVVDAAAAADEGDYHVVVANDLGSTASRIASLRITAETRQLTIADVQVRELETVAVPVSFTGFGGEQSLSFNVGFDPETLQFREALAVLEGSLVFVNTDGLADGRVGVVLSAPPGSGLAPGTSELCRLIFSARDVIGPTPLSPAEVPLSREAVDSFGHSRAFEVVFGEVTVVAAPRITAEPESSAGAPGGTVAFSVEAVGTEPLEYQWRFNGTDIEGATQPTLLLENLRVDQEGRYSVRVRNPVGSVVSADAQLIVGRLLRLDSATGFTGEPVSVPVSFFGLGDENAFGFSVSFDPEVLTFSGVEAGPALGSGAVNVDIAAAESGVVGILAALAPGESVSAGWNQLVRIMFQSGAVPALTRLEFTSAPFPVEVVDREAENVETVSVGGTLQTDVRPVDTTQFPDLTGSNLTGPPEAIVGRPATLSWEVRNDGVNAAAAPYRESVFLSDNPDGTDGQLIAQLTVTDPLPGGAAVTRRQTLVFPPETAGERYLVIQLDSRGEVAERDEENNRVVAAEPIRILAPNLEVADVAGPDSAEFGASIPVSWTVRNQGTAAAGSGWVDRVYLAPRADSLNGAISLVSRPVQEGSLPLDPGAAYSPSVDVDLPLSADLLPGTYFLIVAADADGTQSEAREDDNRASRSIEITPPPLPDLTVVDGSLAVPGSVRAGDSFELRWTVVNQGRAPADSVWRETIRVAPAAGGSSIELALLTFDDVLSSDQTVDRIHSMTFPADGPAGDLLFSIDVDSRNEIVEERESNNRVAAAESTSVPLLLTLRLSAGQIAENAIPDTVRGTVHRNGPRVAPLTVSLANGDPTEVSVPDEVVIPAGAGSTSFSLTVVSDGVVDDSETVILTASAPGFGPGETSIIVVNTDRPRLALDLDPNQIVEGGQSRLMVRRDTVSASPLTVALSSSHPDQLTFPDSVTLGAGESEVEVVVRATDDLLIEDTGAYAISASAPDVIGASIGIEVLDNDLPQIMLGFSTARVSEGAGPGATSGTVVRSPVTQRSLVIELDSSDRTELLVPTRVVIQAGQASVSFPASAVDDDEADGIQLVEVSPWIVTSIGGLRLARGPVATIEVIDDDQPALFVSIDRDLVAEGLDMAATGTVTRNTEPAGDLVVALSAEPGTEATVPDTVTIVDGARSAQFPIATVNDNTPDGNQPVTVTASAAGFISGEDRLIVSDVDLPDLVIETISGPETAETEAPFNLSYRVANRGLSAAAGTWNTRLFLSRDPLIGDDILLTQYTFEGQLPVGQHFDQSLQVRAPVEPGEYWLVAVADVGDLIAEGLENNNAAITRRAVKVGAAYEATVSTELERAPANTPVPLVGSALNPSGGGAAFVLVNIHIRVRDTTRVVSALTDAAGDFATVWNPLPGEAGVYQIGAAHPGVRVAPVQDGFTLVGMAAVPPNPSVRMAEGSSVSGSVRLRNLSDVPLTGLSASVIEAPANLQTSVNPARDELPGLGEITLAYSVTAAEGTGGTGVVRVRVESAEGAVLEIPLEVRVDLLAPRLSVRPTELRAGMARGRQTSVFFDVTNEGGKETGPIDVVLPSVPWMSVASRNPLASLAPGASQRVTLVLTPAADLALGNHEGSLVLRSDEVAIAVPFLFRALSEQKGDLVVNAVDEFTYYAEGAPRVAGAEVILRDAINLETVASGVTDENGRFAVEDVFEGFYNLTVTAAAHLPHQSTVLVVAGEDNTVDAFLSREAVTYTWNVERIEIEDRYKVTIETEFETNVPQPVVTVHPTYIDLAEITAEVTQIDMRITNHGLIAANAMTISFGSHPFWEIKPLIEDVGVLPAQSSLTIPVTIRRLGTIQGATASAAVAGAGLDSEANHGGDRALRQGAAPAAAGGPCGISASVCWRLVCGPFDNTYCTGIQIANAGTDCGVPPVRPGGGGGGGIPYVPGAFASGPGIGVKIVCDPTCLLLAGLGCVPGPVGCFFGGFGCGMGLGDGVEPIDLLDCAVGAAGCLVPGAGLPACIYALTRCIVKPAGGGGGGSGGGSGGAAGQGLFPLAADWSYPRIRQSDRASVAADPVDAFRPALRAMLDTFNEITGAEDGTWINPEADSATGDWYQAFLMQTAPGSDGGREITAPERIELLTMTQPPGVPSEEVNRVIDRWNRTLENWRAGILTRTAAPEGASRDFIDFERLKALVAASAEYQDLAERSGFTDPVNAIVETVRARDEMGEGGGVCARVKLRIEQEAVLSRDAFQATLEINNDATDPIEDLSVEVRVTDASGADVTELFGIRDPELSGISAVDGTGMLSANRSGTASWVLIPSTDAAPEEPTAYWVGGTLAYRQGEATLRIPLAPTSITVHPNPRLFVKYFHQRDVFSDDPFTDAIEPSVPFSLAVMIENRGAGEARDFSITSAQPEIIENEKGLLIDFKIIATEVAEKNLTPSLTADFGVIPAHDTVVGRWLMTSTLQGLFIGYSASFEHIDGLGNPRLSLIEDLSIHEMIRLVEAGGEFADGKPDFLVNELPDVRDLPDTLYLSDGTTREVAVVESGVFDGVPSSVNRSVALTVSMPPGWVYLRLPDPANGDYRLVKLVRPDGTELPAAGNVWVTDRTFIGQGRRPVRESILHVLDFDGPESYTVVYEPFPDRDVEPPESAVAPLPAESRAGIPVRWSGADQEGGAGVQFYDVYVSEDGGPFVRWLWKTVDTGAIYLGSNGKTYAFYSVATDRAGNREAAPATPDAETAVTMINHPPTVASIPDQIVAEGDTVRLTVMATDPDGDELAFSLADGAPAGVVINGQNGELRWFTGEGLGGGSREVTVIVLDNGAPRLGATVTFRILLEDRNNPPVIDPILDRAIDEGELLEFAVSVSDFDLPAQSVRLSLEGDVAEGMTLDQETGLFRWQPDEIQGGRVYEVTVVAGDDGEPPLESRRAFRISVRDSLRDFRLALDRIALAPSGSGPIPLRVESGVPLRSFSMVVVAGKDRLDDVSVAPQIPGVTATVTPVNDSDAAWLLTVSTLAGEPLVGGTSPASLSVTVDDRDRSAWVPLYLTESEALTANGDRLDNIETIAGSVFVLGPQPILVPEVNEGPPPTIAFFGTPGFFHQLEWTAELGERALWEPVAVTRLEDVLGEFELPFLPEQNGFFRIRQF